MIEIIINKDMIPVLITLFLISVVTLVTIAYTFKERMLLPVFIIIPLILGSVYVSWGTISNLLGYPVAVDIPQKSIYIAHAENADEGIIYVWAKPPKSSKPRLYEIPSNENNKKALERSEEKSEKGIPQVISKAQEDASHNGTTRGGEYLTYDFDVGHRQFKNSQRYEEYVPHRLDRDGLNNNQMNVP